MEAGMINVHMVTAGNRHLYEAALEQHFRIRYDIYVRERRWMALDRPDERDFDQFDTDDAIYLLALKDGDVVGGSRFVPTTRPHLMSDVFPALALDGVIRAADVVEWTRIFVRKDHRGEQAEPRVESLMLAAIMEFALEQGYRAITVVMEAWWLPRLLGLGWRVVPLGLPQLIDGMQVMGVSIDVTPAALDSVRAARNIGRSVLTVRGLELPEQQVNVHAG
jgi:acyl-homoserine lactone synthase